VANLVQTQPADVAQGQKQQSAQAPGQIQARLSTSVESPDGTISDGKSDSTQKNPLAQPTPPTLNASDAQNASAAADDTAAVASSTAQVLDQVAAHTKGSASQITQNTAQDQPQTQVNTASASNGQDPDSSADDQHAREHGDSHPVSISGEASGKTAGDAGAAAPTAAPAQAGHAAASVVAMATPDTQAGPPAAVHLSTPGVAHSALPGHPGGAAGPPAVQAMLHAQAQDDIDPNVARIAQGLRSVINLKGGALTIRMNPGELGSVRIDMDITNGVVNAQLQAQHASVRDLLAHEIGQLRDTLQSRGLTVQRLEVQGPSPGNHAGFNQQAQHSPDQGRSRGQFFHQNQSGGQNQGQSSGGQEKNQRQQFNIMLLDMVG
jgi:flagellar hook-length control protein FliK